MKLKTILLTIVISIFSVKAVFSQDYFIHGFVKSEETKEALSYTNIRIDGTTQGTSKYGKIDGNLIFIIDINFLDLPIEP